MTDEFFQVPETWSGMEAALFTDMTLIDESRRMFYDDALRARFHAALYDFDSFAPGHRKLVMDDLKKYMKRHYRVNLDDVFDWDAYRDDISDDL